MSPLIVHTVLQAIDRMLSSGAKSVIITSTELESTKAKLVLLAKNRKGKFLCLYIAKCTVKPVWLALYPAWACGYYCPVTRNTLSHPVLSEFMQQIYWEAGNWLGK